MKASFFSFKIPLVFKLIPTLFLVILITLYFGCSSGDVTPTSTLDKKLLAFTFSNASNDIKVSSTGQISSRSVTVFLPVTTDLTRLVPEFETSANTTVKINGKPATSGETPFDFSETADFTIIAEDQSTEVYKIAVKTSFTTLDNSIQRIMDDYHIPGLQLSITKDEQLVYLKSFGYRDTEANVLVNDSTIFRIASISKPITAIAILKLIENGDLSFDKKVFGAGALLGEKYGTLPYDEDMKLISVRNLLEHKSGWVNVPFDPLFFDAGLTMEELINDMLDNRPLASPPGTTYYYLNFGYSLLGRIIEEVSGKTYEEFVLDEILHPMGISRMKIAGNTLDERNPNEATYYTQEGYSPYLLNVSRMDAAGGWLASSQDLVNFLVHVDRNNKVADILNETSLNDLYFRYENWYFYGSLSGTSSVITRVDDTYGFSVIINTRTIPYEEVVDQLRIALDEEIKSRTAWPDYDLF